MQHHKRKPYWKDALRNLKAELDSPQPLVVVVNIGQSRARSWWLLALLLVIPLAFLLLAYRQLGFVNATLS